jgi:hypothetical protein
MGADAAVDAPARSRALPTDADADADANAWGGVPLAHAGPHTVYPVRGRPGERVIASPRASDCRLRWPREVRVARALTAALRGECRFGALRYVRLAVPRRFWPPAARGAPCHLLEPRLDRPDRTEGPPVFALFGCASCDATRADGARAVGRAEMRRVAGPHAVRSAVWELGVAMGLVHHRARRDGDGVRLLVGAAHGGPPGHWHVYLAGFGRSRAVLSFRDRATVRRMARSLAAGRFFPADPADDPALAALFRRAYGTVVPPRIADRVWTAVDGR